MASQEINLSFGSLENNFWKDITTDVPDNILYELEADLQNCSYKRGTSLLAPEFWTDFMVQPTNSENNDFAWGSNPQEETLKMNDSSFYHNSQIPIGIEPQVLLPIKSEGALSQENPMNKMETDELVAPPPLLSIIPQLAPPLLSEISKKQIQQEKQLEEVVKLQRGVTLSNRDDFTLLQQQLFQIHQQITQELKELESLLTKEILSPPLLSSAQTLTQLLQLQQQKTDLLKIELQHIANEDAKCIVALTIIEQPGPSVIFKGRAIEAPFSVKLITGAKVDLAKIGTITATISDEETWKSNKPLSNDIADLNVIENKATIKDLKVNVSTRMTAIHLRFMCNIKDKNIPGEFLAKSTLTNPFIVITNESQWKEAAGKLLLADAFPTQKDSIPWPFYVNILHSHLLRATNQDPMKPNRGFSQEELQYIQERFFDNKGKITFEEGAKCWNWLGAVLTTIRFKRHVRPLWIEGFIFGLVSKKECNRLLKKEHPGTFLLRFSDSVAGSFAVAYSTEDEKQRVKHYLIKPEEIGANKSLPEFLREKKVFRTLIKLDPSSGKIIKLDKNSAFNNYYKEPNKKMKSKEMEPETHGYVQNLETES